MEKCRLFQMIPEIYDYTEYQTYLRDWVEAVRKKSSIFSYRQFALKAGTAPSLLRDVITRRRRLTLATQVKFSKAMKLDRRATEYFALLVQFQHTKENTERNRCFEQLMKYRLQQKIRYLQPEQYAFWMEWWHSAIRELVTLPQFKEEAGWIAQQLNPPISVGAVRNSIQLQLKLGLLKRDRKGKLRQSDPVISSEYELSSLAVRSFHAQMIDLGRQSLERFPLKDREVSSLTLGVNERTFERIKQKIRIFKEEILSMVEEEKGDSDRVLQFNFQLFPLILPQNEEEKL